MTQPTDAPTITVDMSLPAPTKPLVKGVEVERGQWAYIVMHEDITAPRSTWRQAYERAQGVALIQAMVHDALGGVLRG